MNEENKNKQIDGLRKKEAWEIKRSRELVLHSIGEKAKKKTPQAIKQKNNNSRQVKVDSIFFQKNDKKEIDNNKKKELSIEKIKKAKKKLPKEVLLDNIQTFDGVKPASSQKFSSTPIKSLPANKKTKLIAKKDSKKIIQLPAVKPTKKRLAKLKSQSNKLTKSKKRNLGTIQKKKNKSKINWQKKIKKLRLKIKQKYIICQELLKKAWQQSMVLGGIIFSFSLFIYLLLAMIFLNFGNKMPVFNNFISWLSIPAIVSADGLLDLSRYQQFAYNRNWSGKDQATIHKEIAQLFILDKLYKKHQVDNLSALQKILPFDEEVNMAPITRIRKIKKAIKNKSDFIKIAQKLGDVSRADITSNNLSEYPFAQAIKNIKKNETSDIITTAQGYYIVHCFDKRRDKLSVSYVFMPTVSLAQYLEDEVTNYHFWKLVHF